MAGNLAEKRETVYQKVYAHKLTYCWLMGCLAKRGLNVSKSVMSNAVRGIRENELSQRIIDESLLILASYEAWEQENGLCS